MPRLRPGAMCCISCSSLSSLNRSSILLMEIFQWSSTILIKRSACAVMVASFYNIRGVCLNGDFPNPFSTIYLYLIPHEKQKNIPHQYCLDRRWYFTCPTVCVQQATT